MLGWTILFALMAVLGATATTVPTLTLLFVLLFVASLLTWAVRDRARW